MTLQLFFVYTCEAPKVSSGTSEYLCGLFRTPLEEEEVQLIVFEGQGRLTSIYGSPVSHSDNLWSINSCRVDEEHLVLRNGPTVPPPQMTPQRTSDSLSSPSPLFFSCVFLTSLSVVLRLVISKE